MTANNNIWYTYALNNPLRFTDPSGYYNKPSDLERERRDGQGYYYNYEMAWKLGGNNRTPFANAFSYLNASGGWEFNGPTGGYVNRQTGERMSADQFNAQVLDPSFLPSTVDYSWEAIGTVTYEGIDLPSNLYGRVYSDGLNIGTTGVGISLELALPGIFIKDLFGRKNDYTGVGIDFGILKDRKGRGVYLTLKKTKEFGVALSAQMEWFGAHNTPSSTNIDINRTYIDEYGSELSLGVGPVGYAFSRDQGYLFLRESIFDMQTISIGIGLEAGYVEWNTRTFVSGKRRF